MQSVRQFLDDNLQNPLLSRTSAVENLSPFYLSRASRTATGASKRFVRERRLEKAKRSLLEGKLITIVAPLGRSVSVDASNQAMPALVRRMRGRLSPTALRRVGDYIDAHLGKKISIRALADIVGLSPFHFARAFKQSTGVSPHHYLVRRRIERVMELLARTELPIADIALVVGFSDQSHCAPRFSRARRGIPK
jgi:AraC-like DNA-binding protein